MHIIKKALMEALLDDRLDIIATDHAPHTLEEKNNSYFKSPSGGPLVQHSVQAMMEFSKQGKITIGQVVTRMSHHPAILFRIEKRGFVREGYFADLVLVDPGLPQTVSQKNILSKCAWSPFEGHTFSSSITHTWVSGHLAFDHGSLDESTMGKRLLFGQDQV